MAGGGGKTSTIGSTPFKGVADPEINAFAREVREQSAPVRSQLYSQMGEALTTGGVGARIPIIQRGVEASNAATSEAMRGFEADTAAGDPNFAKSPYYQRIRNEIRQTGLARSADIGPSIAKSFIDQAPSVALGTGNTVVTGLTNAANIGSQNAIASGQQSTARQVAKMDMTAKVFASMMSSMGSAAGSA